MKSLVSQTPSFLGDDLASLDEAILFACEEKESTQGKDSLAVNGRSTWKTSKGICDLQPRVLPKQLLLAVGSRLDVTFSEESFLSEWPRVQGLSSYDKGNYLSVLYLAWAYILSARWVELLDRSADHDCHLGYSALPQSDKQPMVHIDIGDDACEQEVLWWRAILFSDDGWDATTKYNGHVYLSPWSVSTKNMGFTLATNAEASLGAGTEPPSSMTAFEYISRFCARHRLCAQCSVALAGVLYIPFLRGRTVSLPLPRQASQSELKNLMVTRLFLSRIFSLSTRNCSLSICRCVPTHGVCALFCVALFSIRILNVIWPAPG